MARRPPRVIHIPSAGGRATRPDGVIAAAERVSVDTVRRARKRAGILPYSSGRPRTNEAPARRWTVTASVATVEAVDRNAALVGKTRSDLFRALADPYVIAVLVAVGQNANSRKASELQDLARRLAVELKLA